MILNLELTDEEAALLNGRAQAEGVTLEAIVRGLIARLAPPSPVKTPEIGALLSAIRSEDAADDPEEIAEREREQTEMQNNIARWRAEQRR